MTILEMNHVSKAFGGSQALTDIHFSVEEGEIHALLGENGAGKSTLMNILTRPVVILINKRYPEGDQLKRTLIQLCTAALIMTVYVLWTTDLSAYRLGAKDIGLLLLLGVVMTAAAYIAYFGLVVRIPSGSVAFFSYADPVVAVIISVFFLGEPFSIYTFIGAVMIIGAAIVAEGGFKKK